MVEKINVRGLFIKTLLSEDSFGAFGILLVCMLHRTIL